MQRIPLSDHRPVPVSRHSGPAWPRPPACLRACDLGLPPEGARVAVAGLVILRQRPGTAKGVIFVTLEDETGVVNVIVWRKIYERFRRAVIAGRMLRVTGRMQRAHSVTHVIAEKIEDISDMLDLLVRPETGAGFAPGAEMR
ncbi:OB-fold nucleic acid binding domain-containing protein [Ruegeria marina]|uniref:Error-prone DNA polymerase n=1 Tax=Ruegeria marina TaxID=639004 RepID=A0A1G6KQ04_9RHOB|nr:OB-fold nucleic acid binding domain-containing protein [Ruegeria marina]SDC32605.1 DNA-directed RNA polymerase [Ruegeria marina]